MPEVEVGKPSRVLCEVGGSIAADGLKTPR